MGSDWLLIIAIGLVVVSVCATVDFLLHKKEISKINARLFQLSEQIAKIPLLRWQVKIAEFAVFQLLRFGNYGRKFENPEEIQKSINLGQEKLELEEIELEQSDIERSRKLGAEAEDEYRRQRTSREASRTRIGAFFTISTIALLSLFMSNTWLVGMLGVPLLITFGFFLPVVAHEMLFGFNATNVRLSSGFILISSSSLLSALVTMLASTVSVSFVPDKVLNSRWFISQSEELVPTDPFLLALVNYPFDFATLLVTIILLKFVITKKRFLGTVAIIDIVVSFILTTTLHTTLTLIKAENTENVLLSLQNSAYWLLECLHNLFFILLGIYDWNKLYGYQDVHLVPVIVSTFIPVVLYMCLFINISILKPGFWFTARIFSAISEKEQSIFTQVGVIISLVMGALKAIYDYLEAVAK